MERLSYSTEEAGHYRLVRCKCPKVLGPVRMSLALKNFLGDLAYAAQN